MVICRQCHSHLTSDRQIISRGFHGQFGRAYFVDRVINVHQGPAEDRAMATGIHCVCDLKCNSCDRVLGWQYLHAYEQSQKYKENKCVLEAARVANEFQALTIQ